MHYYTVEFVIYTDKDEFDIDSISNTLGITPSNFKIKGEPISDTNSKVHSESMWGYSVSPESGHEDWESLEDGLKALLNIFLPLENKIRHYLTRYQVVIWCGHFSSSFDGGPTLSADVLRQLGKLGAELFLDTYFITDNEDNNAAS